MTEKRLFAGWLRSLTGLVAAAGILALSACGGGSGAPNNFYAKITAVPEPSTLALGAAGLAASWLLQRRRSAS